LTWKPPVVGCFLDGAERGVDEEGFEAVELEPDGADFDVALSAPAVPLSAIFGRLNKNPIKPPESNDPKAHNKAVEVALAVEVVFDSGGNFEVVAIHITSNPVTMAPKNVTATKTAFLFCSRPAASRSGCLSILLIHDCAPSAIKSIIAT